MITSVKSKVFLLGLFLSFSLFSVLFFQGEASAVGVSTRQPSIGEDITRLSVSATGTWNNPLSISTLYVPAGAATGSVVISDITNQINSGGKIASFRVRDMDGAGNCVGSYLDSAYVLDMSSTAAQRTLSFTNNGPLSSINTLYRAYCVEVTSDTSVNGPGGCSGPSGCFSMNIVFRLYTSGSSLLGNYSGPNLNTGTGYFQNLTNANNDDKWSITLNFAPPCDGNFDIDKNLALYDLDTYAPVNSGIRFRMQEADKGASNWADLSLDITSPNGVSGSASGYYPINVGTGQSVFAHPNANYKAEKRYRILVTGIGQNNKIRILLPFDQLAAEGTCPETDNSTTCSITNVTYPTSNRARIVANITSASGIARGSASGGLHIGVSSVGDPSGTWDDAGVPNPAPDRQTNYVGRSGNRVGLTHYTESAGGFTYNRYYVTNGQAPGTFSITFEVDVNSTSRDLVVRMLKRSFPAEWLPQRCSTPISNPTPTTSCSAGNVSGFTNESVSFSATVTTSGNTSGYTLKGHHRINSGGYTAWGNISGSTFTGSATFSSVGQRTITIEVGYFNPSTASSPTSGTTSTCTLTVTIRNRVVTCANTTADSWVGQARTYSATLSNTGDSSVTVSVAISATGGTVSPTSRSVAVGANTTNTASTTGTANSSAGSFVITWSVTTPNSNSSGTGAAAAQTCTTTITKHALPTCRVNSGALTTYDAGVWGQTSAELVYADAYRGGSVINVSSNETRYRYNDGAPNTTYGGTLGTAGVREGQATRTSDTYIRLSNSDRTATQRTYQGGVAANGINSGSTRVMVPGLYGNAATPAITWTVDWRDGSFNPVNLTCTSNLSVPIQPLECIDTTNEFNLNTPDRATISIQNPNPDGVDVQVIVGGGANRSTFTANGATPNSGNVEVNDGVAGSDIAGLTNRGFRTAVDIQYASTGSYIVGWDINTEYRASGYSADTTGNCGLSGSGGTLIGVSRRPYLRTYGNDVFAGTSIVNINEPTSVCDLSSVGNVPIRSVGGVSDTGYYQGSAAELAAIATGSISNFLPGVGSYLDSSGTLYPNSPLRGNTVFDATFLDFLTFAGGGVGLDNIGGAYTSGGLCNEAFPDVSEWNDGGSILSDGRRTRSGNVTLSGTTIATGDRVSLYVDGNVTITGSITYSNPTAWTSTDDVPLLRIFATGDINISGAATNLDGLFVAGGTIRTCTEFQETDVDATVTSVIAACGNEAGSRRFTLRGAFVANDVIFGRTAGDVTFSNANPTTTPETVSAGGNKAETLVFFPELYIALWDEAIDSNDSVDDGDPSGAFDYISSPPPAF